MRIISLISYVSIRVLKTWYKNCRMKIFLNIPFKKFVKRTTQPFFQQFNVQITKASLLFEIKLNIICLTAFLLAKFERINTRPCWIEPLFNKNYYLERRGKTTINIEFSFCIGKWRYALFKYPASILYCVFLCK